MEISLKYVNPDPRVVKDGDFRMINAPLLKPEIRKSSRDRAPHS